MNHRKIIFFLIPLTILACAIIIVFNIFTRTTQQNKLSGGNPLSYGTLPVVTSSLLTTTGPNGAVINNGTLPIITSSPAAGSDNAFINKGNNGVVLPQNPNTGTSPSLPTNNGVSIGASSTKVTSLGDVQNVISSASSMEKPATTTLFALPDVSDSEITIDPSGVSTTITYLIYFNAHSSNIAFDASEFNNVLKDENGMTLFVPDLVEKAIADNNFAEIKSSLLAQKDFIVAAEKFLSSIKVTGDAIMVNKKVIGSEELTENLADQAILAASGSVSRSDIINDYARFDATISAARNDLVQQSGVLSLGKNNNNGIVGNILRFLGLNTPAAAQSAGTPFGGVVSFIIPCICDLGEIVTIGVPVPAEVFVPAAFLATPLFFPYKANHTGAWWLGLDISEPVVPCNTPLPYCPIVGGGSEIIMAGTSP